ncbi:MAG TPA: septum formation initiator family protein [Kiritimatiellia bacterium]|nr:septum formation initiator family protein [Kiritimatiellia bacterium]
MNRTGKKETSIWTVLYRFSAMLLVALAVFTLIRVFYPRFHELTSLSQRRAMLEEQIRAEEEHLENLRNKQERLRNDPRYVERIAREELGYAKPGEIVFKFEDDPPAGPRPRR